MSDAKPKLLQIIDRDGTVVGVANVGEAATQAIEDLPKGYVLTPTVAADDGLFGFRLDAVPAQSTERVAQLEVMLRDMFDQHMTMSDAFERVSAIVRGLEAADPEHSEGHDGEYLTCTLCQASTFPDVAAVTVVHEESCPWRRARELMSDV